MVSVGIMKFITAELNEKLIQKWERMEMGKGRKWGGGWSTNKKVQNHVLEVSYISSA